VVLCLGVGGMAVNLDLQQGFGFEVCYAKCDAVLRSAIGVLCCVVLWLAVGGNGSFGSGWI
jgi:hypothetical protein